MIRNQNTSIIEDDYYVYTEEEQLTLIPKNVNNTIKTISIPTDTKKPVITETRDGKKYSNKINELPIEILQELDSKGKLIPNDNTKNDDDANDNEGANKAA